MENVPDLVQTNYVRQFNEIQLVIEKMGYINYVEILNAKDYGVAQNRARVFMVSVLGEYNYDFPKPIKLDKRLKDYLEDNVDEKYYLSDEQLKGLYETEYESQGIDRVKKVDDEYINTINTMQGGNREPKIAYALSSREFKSRGFEDLAPTLCARDYKDPKIVMIPEATKKGYAEASDGDGVYINRPHQKRGVVQKDMIQTIKTSGDDLGVVEHQRIRKLTPLECWRLMGISDDDFYKVQSVCSNSQLYKQAGNAIVVDVFEAILRSLVQI